MEIFKDVVGYEVVYQVSNLGRVKSLSRQVWMKRNQCFKTTSEIILKQEITRDGYKRVRLYKDNSNRGKLVHQLVTESFMGHVPNGRVIVPNHINHDRTDNRIENLEIVTTRENTNKKHLKSSSKYTGVHWAKDRLMWIANIGLGTKKISLGQFNTELEASNRYQLALKHINEYNGNTKEFREYLVNL